MGIQASAGMDAATAVLRAESRTELLARPGTPLGLFPEADYERSDFFLRSGDSLFLCTDGVLDVANGDGERFGKTKLGEVLSRAVTSRAGLPEAMEQALHEFAGNTPWCDDVCFIIVDAA